jgi:hypothetical protein
VISIQKLRKLMKFNVSPFFLQVLSGKVRRFGEGEELPSVAFGAMGLRCVCVCVCVCVCLCVCVFVCARERSLSPVCVLGMGTYASLYFLSPPLLCVVMQALDGGP